MNQLTKETKDNQQQQEQKTLSAIFSTINLCKLF